MWKLSKRLRASSLSHSQLEAVVIERTAELQMLSQRLLKVQDEEKRKLARDLHDSTGQTLAALKISISFLQAACQQDAGATALVAEVESLADRAVQEIRTMSYLSHPPLLEEVGFVCAAEWFAEGFAKRSGINVTLDIVPPAERLPFRVETTLFRVLQESLTNVHRHSGAREVRIFFRRLPNKLILEVRDSGHGIPQERLKRLRQASAETGVGLAGMRERLLEMNGRLEIESDSDGTGMRAIIPLYPVGRAGHADSQPRVGTSDSSHDTRCMNVIN